MIGGSHGSTDIAAQVLNTLKTFLSTVNPASTSTLYHCQGWQLRGLPNSKCLIAEIKVMAKSIVLSAQVCANSPNSGAKIPILWP